MPAAAERKGKAGHRHPQSAAGAEARVGAGEEAKGRTRGDGGLRARILGSEHVGWEFADLGHWRARPAVWRSGDEDEAKEVGEGGVW